MADWTRKEVDHILEDYFQMLKLEIEGRPFNKAEHNRNLQQLIDRSKGSIEFKHQNISAVLKSFGIPFIKGYLPATNFQKSVLIPAVSEYVQAHTDLEKLFGEFVVQVPPIATSKQDFKDALEIQPEVETASLVSEPDLEKYRPTKKNYLQLEQENKKLGDAGEAFAFEYEKWRLINAGKESWADKVEWISQSKGDGAGFDILSKNDNGSDRYIEVKSTKLTKNAPIFFSDKELRFSQAKSENYFLYRVFNLPDDPKLFMAQGSFDQFCTIRPTNYVGNF